MNASLTYSPILTQASADYLIEQDSLKVLGVIPTVEVSSPLGAFLKQNIAERRRVELKEQAFGEDILGSVPDTTPVAYQLYPLTKRMDIGGVELNALSGLMFNNASPEQVELGYARASATIVAQKILRKMGDTFLNPSLYPAGNKTGSAIDWSNVSTATPVTNIITYKRAVKKESGYDANTAIMTAEVFDRLINNLEVKSNFAGGTVGRGEGMNGLVDEQRLAVALGLKNVLVVDATWNTGAAGATASNTSVVSSGQYFLLAHLSDTQVIGNTVANTLGLGLFTTPPALTGSRIDSGYNNGLNISIPFPISIRKSYDANKTGYGVDSIIAEAVMGYQMVYPEFGYLATVTV
jgi:hypothetical protein